MKVTVRCLTNGAMVCGKQMRATQQVELEVDDVEDARLRVIEAAGDIEVTREAVAMPPVARPIRFSELENTKP